MATQDGASSFEAMIHADRNRKKNEDLANQIFGRSKSSQNVNKKQKQQEPRSPSLASRMGVQKRSSSTSVPTQNKNPFNPPSRPSSTTPSHRNSHNNNAARANRIATELNSGNANINPSTSRNSSFRNDRNGEVHPQSQPTTGAGPGFTIKGSAGPFTLLASNFDPGTTEADIEAALYSELFDEKGNNTLTSCRIISNRPSVVAEMVLTERSVADKIIRKFHNLKADGRILKVVLTKSGPGPERRKDTSRGGSAVAQSVEQQEMTEDPPIGSNVAEGDMEMDDTEITTDYPATSSYDHQREAADRDRRDRDRNRDREDYPAGSRRDDRRESDRPREDRDRRRDDRDRDRERDDDDRDRERDRDRDREHRDPAREPQRERDRDYERREPYEGRPAQPRPPPTYGNGFNRGSRGGYGYGGRGGYGFPRGGYGGRGSYRGGY